MSTSGSMRAAWPSQRTEGGWPTMVAGTPREARDSTAGRAASVERGSGALSSVIRPLSHEAHGAVGNGHRAG
jgi:hypothetical protein